MRRRTLLKLSNEGSSIVSTESIAGDICLYNKISEKLCLVSQDDFSAETYPSTNYSPVGVVVVPGTHDVYGDGSCAIVSVVDMHCDTPTTGSTTPQSMLWGDYGTNITSLTDYTVVPILGYYGNMTENIQMMESNGYLPFDSTSTTGITMPNPYDSDTKYIIKAVSAHYIPSPYKEDDTRNPLYHQTTEPSSTANAMSDFDGVGNTNKILAQRGVKDYSSWKPTYSSQTDYPAASCCDMFYTDGTKQGEWYLPAAGELGYIMPKINKINTTINTLKNTYGNVSLLSDADGVSFFSSTEFSSNYCYILYTFEGWFNETYKDDDQLVNMLKTYTRAFLRVK